MGSGFPACWEFSCDPNAVQGRYVFKLLAVDVPSAAGPEQRIYLEGDQRTYNRGAVLREMRDPLLNVSACLLADKFMSFLTLNVLVHAQCQACALSYLSHIKRDLFVCARHYIGAFLSCAGCMLPCCSCVDARLVHNP